MHIVLAEMPAQSTTKWPFSPIQFHTTTRKIQNLELAYAHEVKIVDRESENKRYINEV